MWVGALSVVKRAVALMVWFAVVVAGLGMLQAESAGAETVSTAQARIAGAQFLATAGPPSSSAAICVVDTGAELTPDTGGIQARMSLWDDVISDTSPTRHGTHVATLIGASRNGWGMVGIWPAARLVTIRANTTGEDRFTVASYYQGMRRCRSVAGYYGIKVILLALGSDTPLSEEEHVVLSDEVASTRQHDVSVVASAGNNSGGSVQTPAQLPGVLSVGGSSADGARCAISAVGAALQAPGCGLDAIDASGNPITGVQGNTEASAVTAAALAALRSYRPDLTPDAAENLLASTATAAPGGPLLNVTAAFRAAGLGGVVESAPPLEQPEPQRPPDPQPPPQVNDGPDLSPPPPKARLPRPRATVRRAPRRPRIVIVTLRNRPRRVHVDVGVHASTPRVRQGAGRSRLKLVAHRRMRARVVRLRVPARRLRVTVRYTDSSHARKPSRPYIARLPAAKGKRR